MHLQAPHCRDAIDSLEALDRAIHHINACSSETEVDTLLRTLLAYFDADSYVFVSVRRDRKNRESFRYLVGCAPAWSQTYNAKKWFAIDPLILYALRHSTPIIGSAIKSESNGQSELLATAAENGFRSSIIVPAHAAGANCIGVLWVGSEQPQALGEPRLWECRNFLRAIAMELFEWSETKHQAEMLDRYRFDNTDVQLLALERDGFTAEDAAKFFGLTTSQVNGRFRRINDKLDVHHKKHAVRRAKELGILRA